MSLGDSIPYGMNLIHSPGEPELEAAVVDLYLRRGVRLVEASAFLNLTLPVVRYRVAGLRRDGSGRIVAPNRIIAKVSRVEVASKFMAPPPAQFLRELVATGEITPEQAEWAARIPMADDITAEADSGGHTDNQPAIVLLADDAGLARPDAGAARLRSAAAGRRGRRHLDAVGGGGGAGDGGGLHRDRVGQPVVRRGGHVRRGPADARAGAAGRYRDGPRGRHVRDGGEGPGAQARHAVRDAGRQALRALPGARRASTRSPPAERANLEKTIFRAPLETIWEQTKDYFRERDPSRIERAERDPKQKMALVFRWYLGMSSHWANSGEPSRTVDYQIWCGPAMAAFNDWVRGSFLEQPENRRVATVALNILYGAAVLTRARIASIQGLAPASRACPRLTPLELDRD